MIRLARNADRGRCLMLLKKSHEAAGFPWPFRGANAYSLFVHHTSSPDACCFVLDVGGVAQGILMASAFDHPFGAGRWAKETVWFVAEAHRGRGSMRMLDAYEAWAKEQGCVVIGMASLASNDVSALYERRGFASAETHFLKFI
ncbi:acetyltransferase (GNAT) family protein [Rhizobium subbaraonis]|uniref:Acetyltransferase (GNAT) family protein n=1 Tax=Rhizobium subbaraonis TaxID=908946 RepID=A0A285UAP6_9HYPH|nr:GNAT family N-acetyltransferase [Rhizobium subbaraonis]SOC38970.1 acetyltransferase (GNAT) family protein [Rhizobium subbaraonis]